MEAVPENQKRADGVECELVDKRLLRDGPYRLLGFRAVDLDRSRGDEDEVERALDGADPALDRRFVGHVEAVA